MKFKTLKNYIYGSFAICIDEQTLWDASISDPNFDEFEVVSIKSVRHDDWNYVVVTLKVSLCADDRRWEKIYFDKDAPIQTHIAENYGKSMIDKIQENIIFDK